MGYYTENEHGIGKPIDNHSTWEIEHMSRTKNVIKNTKFGIISKIISMSLSFVSRTIFIYYLGSVYLGVGGLFSDILQVLSFAELGFGNALILAMYKPVADNDVDRIEKLLNFYKKVYRIIALIIATGGAILIPFLPYIIKGADGFTINEIRTYYVLYLFNTVISYFVIYKFSYINALQKNYIQTNIELIRYIVTASVQIIMIIVFRSFLVYLLVESALWLISRIVISIYLNRRFPILKSNSKTTLSKEEQKPIFKDVRGLALHQFSSIAVHSTDSIIISTFTGAGVIAVGLISNYDILINAVLGFVLIIFNSVTSSFGNLVATSTTEDYRKTFLTANFINFWIYGFCSIAFFVLIPPFISLWIGKEYIIDTTSFLLIIVNCYLQGQSTIYNNARIGKGNFNKDKWLAVIQALTNLIVSVIFANSLGLIGVYIGTVASRLTYVIFRPLSTYKFLFGKSSKEYYVKLISYFLIVSLAGYFTWLLSYNLLQEVTIIKFIICACIVAIVPNLLFFLTFFRSREFKDIKNRIKNYLSKKEET